MLQAQQILQERYRLQESLGNNAGRQTWLADDLKTPLEGSPQKVILKFLAFSPQMEWDEYKLFEREAQVLKSLNHPRIPRYQDYFSLDKIELSSLAWFCLVQDYIPGHSLQKLLNQGTRFSIEKVHSIAKQVLEILVYLHGLETPVLHRDIKPSNLILNENNEIYLVDFGAVQDPVKVEGSTFTVVGTAGYAPLEQFWGKALPASDLYALGATLIHLLTGVPPLDLPQQDLRIKFSDRISLSKPFLHWLETLVEPDLDQRFSSAQQALEALENPDQLTNHSPSLGVPQSKVSLLRIKNELIIRIPKGKRDLETLVQFLIQTTLLLSSLLFVAIPVLILGLMIIGSFFGMLYGALHGSFILIIIATSAFFAWSFKKIDRQFSRILKRLNAVTQECFGCESIQGSGQWIKIEGISDLKPTSRSGYFYKIEEIQSIQYLPFQGIVLKIADRDYYLATQVSEAEREWVYDELQAWLKDRSRQ